MYPILDRIRSVKDLRKLDHNALRALSAEIREYIVDVVSRTGGHLAPSLGVVELTVALHYVFDTPRDRIIWDVGHQCYAHKIITGRKKEFATMRTFGGLSGFPKVTESEFDTYNVGHSSTSLSLAIGEAVARDLAHGSQKIIAVIGDGSLTGGLSYEALNQIGSLNKDLIIVLNDNEHSISRNVGAMSAYLTKLISGSIYNRIRRRYYNFLKKIPGGGGLWSLFKKVESRIKGLILPGQIFEELGIRYFGPIDGHNIEQLIELFERLRTINSGPKMVHIITKKGKGYLPAEKDPARFHGVGPFIRENGKNLAAKKIMWSDVAGETLALIARDDKKIIAVTAAMKDGTGLTAFEKVAPKRLFDVGIAEQHAVTFATALAKNGYKPFVAIYSTFLQRAYDQLVHDTAIMNLPVTFLVDRAGIVGEDGETHQGLLDLVFLKSIPNFTVLAPSSGAELRDMIRFAATRTHGPLAIRYPRGGVPDQDLSLSRVVRATAFPARETSHGKDVALLCVGEMTGYAARLEAALLPLRIRTRIVDLRSVKPLDMNTITKAVRATRYFVTLECGHRTGGVGEEIVARLEGDLRQRHILSVSFPDRFITHGMIERLFEEYGISVEQSAARIKARFYKGSRRG